MKFDNGSIASAKLGYNIYMYKVYTYISEETAYRHMNLLLSLASRPFLHSRLL